MDQQHRRSTAQNQIAPLAVLADQPVKVRQVPVSSADKNFQQRLQQRILELADHRSESLDRKGGDAPQLIRIGDQRKRHLLQIAGRRRAVGRLDDHLERPLGNGRRCERAVRAPGAAQRQHLLGRGKPAAIHGMHFFLGKVAVPDRAGRTSRDAMSADDAGVRVLHADRPLRGGLRENDRRTHPHASAAPDTGRVVYAQRYFHNDIISISILANQPHAAEIRNHEAQPVSDPLRGRTGSRYERRSETRCRLIGFRAKTLSPHRRNIRQTSDGKRHTACRSAPED